MQQPGTQGGNQQNEQRQLHTHGKQNSQRTQDDQWLSNQELQACQNGPLNLSYIGGCAGQDVALALIAHGPWR